MDANSNFRRRLRRLDAVDYFLAAFLSVGTLVAAAVFILGLFVSVETFGLFWGILSEVLIGSIFAFAAWGIYIILFRD